MKTEKEFLISYLYKEGYTEEEMYNASVLRAVSSSLSFRMLYAAYLLKEMAVAAVKAFKDWASNLMDSLMPVGKEPPGIFGGTMKHASFQESLKAIDQVIDRKPRHLVKKIIR